MTWFSILKKKDNGWEGKLNDEKVKSLERKPKLRVKIPKLSYPDNSTEIDKVIQVMKEKKLSPSRIKECDLNLRDMLMRIVGENKKDYEEFIKDIDAYTMQEKMRYRRARPFQFSDKIDKYKTTTVATPSFPSGHSMEAYALATVLAHKHPKKKKELMETADDNSHSRIQMGVHYPSDAKAGKQIGELLGRAYIREVLS